VGECSGSDGSATNDQSAGGTCSNYSSKCSRRNGEGISILREATEPGVGAACWGFAVVFIGLSVVVIIFILLEVEESVAGVGTACWGFAVVFIGLSVVVIIFIVIVLRRGRRDAELLPVRVDRDGC